jgi:mono/diheme cytochrome c family protein
MKKVLILACIILALIIACKKAPQQEQAQTPPAVASEEPKEDTSEMGEMSGAELSDKGIGPIKELKLAAIDQNMVKTGDQLFQSKCALCHTMDQKKVGPPLREEMEEHSPEFIMNLLLNTVEMQQKNEHMKAEVKEFVTVMPDPKLTQDQARAILEYLRSQVETEPKK